MKNKSVIGVGAGGHAKVIIDILLKEGIYDIKGMVDINTNLKGTSILGIPIISGEGELIRLYDENIRLAFVAVASISDTKNNKKTFEYVQGLGFEIINVVHESAVIAGSVKMGCGNRIFAGTIINPDSVLGNNVVINTGAIVDHDCRIEDHAQIGPGAQLAGNVNVGEGSFIGLGASVIQGVRIGKYSIIGAGSAVINNVADNVTIGGVPAKQLKSI